MATKLFLRDTTDNAIGVFKDALTTIGSDSFSKACIVDTAASGTQIQWTQTAGGTVAEWISGRVPTGGFTLSGTMTFSIWARESSMNANIGARARVFKRTDAGVETEIGGGPWNDDVEFGTSGVEIVWTGTPTSTAFAENDRIIVRYYITNIGTMASGHTGTLNYDSPAAGADSFFQINETVAFKGEEYSADLVGQTTSVSQDTVTAGVGEVTVALTGQSVSVSRGSILMSTAKEMTGQLVAAAAGLLLAVASIIPNSQQINATIDNVIASSSSTVTLTGQSLTTSLGVITAESIYEVPLSGQYVVVGAREGVFLPLASQSITAAIGSVTVTNNDVNAALAGQSTNIGQGSLLASILNSAALTGQSISATSGLVTGASSPILTGQFIAAVPGNITSLATPTLTGQNITVSRGSLTPDRATALLGSSVALGRGSVSQTTAPTLVGQTVAVSRGSLALTQAPGLLGQSLSVNRGTIAPAERTLGLTGENIAISNGLVVSGSNVAASLIGQNISVAQGTIVASGFNININLTGQSLSSSQNNLVSIVASALAGQTITASRGSINSLAAPILSGEVITASRGAVSNNHLTDVSGQSVTTNIGNVGTTSNGTIILTGQSVSASFESFLANSSLGLNGQNIIAGVVPGLDQNAAATGHVLSLGQGNLNVVNNDKTAALIGQNNSVIQGTLTAIIMSSHYRRRQFMN